MRVPVIDPDYYHRTQHAMRHNYDGELYEGHMIKIAKTGYWDGKYHYGVFVKVFDEITGAESAVNIKHFKKDVDRFEVIDHRQCVWCRGRLKENRLQKNGEYKEVPCSKCDGSGIMGGRVYTVSSNPERSIIAVDLSYQDDGKTLKVFVKDRG